MATLFEQPTTGLKSNALDRLGLKCGQRYTAVRAVYRTAYWYNQSGEVLGWGDLSGDDFHRIASRLNDGELLFVTRRIGRAQIGDSIDRGDILKSVPFVIGAKCLYLVAAAKDTFQNPYSYGGLSFEVLSADEALERFRGSNT